MLQTASYNISEIKSNFIMEPMGLQQKLRVATTDHIFYFDIRDIVRIQSLSNYSRIFFTSGKSILVCKVLAYFDELLADYHFVRIHRTHLVNLFYIRRYSTGNATSIDLSNDEVLPVSRAKKKSVQRQMQMLSL